MSDPITSQQPRFLPGSTAEGRTAIYERILGVEETLDLSRGPSVTSEQTSQDTAIAEPFVILNGALTGIETVTVDVFFQPPGHLGQSILAAPVVLDATSPVGARIALPLATGMLGAIVPEGSLLSLSVTPAAGPTGYLGVSLPLDPAS
jgi:hypothetical protein